MASPPRAAKMTVNPLTFMEDLHDVAADADIHLFPDQAEGHGIPGAVHLDMIVQSDPRHILDACSCALRPRRPCAARSRKIRKMGQAVPGRRGRRLARRFSPQKITLLQGFARPSPEIAGTSVEIFFLTTVSTKSAKVSTFMLHWQQQSKGSGRPGGTAIIKRDQRLKLYQRGFSGL